MTDLEKLKAALAVQCDNGNWNYSPYMHGMANGMLYALALWEGTEPKYLDAPSEWLCDKKTDPGAVPTAVGPT